MRLVQFDGVPYKAQEMFNKWAKGKVIARDVIIHSHITCATKAGIVRVTESILIFFDERIHQDWVGKDDTQA